MSKEPFHKELLRASQGITRDIETKWPDFRLNFIFFRRGQRQDECERTLSGLAGHPCESSARDLLRAKNMGPEGSAFLGIATGVEKGFLGFGKKIKFTGFAAINVDLYKTEEDALFEMNHLTAQALDTFMLINKKSLNFDDPDIILQPKRNQLSLARNNLRSDIFSALVMYSNGWESAVQNLAKSRGRRALVTQTFYRPEDYPFVIATDVMNYSIKNLLNNKNNTIVSLFELSGKISTSFDKHNLKSWINFAGPAQTMAWSGFTEDQILGTAINTSPDPFIKATGNLLCEITSITPDMGLSVTNGANPFVDDQINQINHARLTEETFEMAIIHAIEAESHLPFIRIANNQNEALLKGRVLGWCADALQSAAKTFDQTMKKGMPPAPASRIEFQRLVSKSEWQSLNNLTAHVIAQRRNGHAMTFTDIGTWCTSRFDLRPVMDSINMTMNDPDYAQKLVHANEVPTPGPRAAVAPSAAPKAAPAANYAPAAAVGMGGGMMGGSMSGGRVSAPPPVQRLKTQEDQDN